MNKRFFQKSGRLGGQRRARSLTPGKRSEIASRAARIRWRKPLPEGAHFESVRFQRSNFEDPAYLEEVLVDGSLADWKQVYEQISDRPFGATANSLKRVLMSTQHYGVNPLWMGILRNVQGGS